MLPQTRRKLRIFSGVSLIVGCCLVATIWFLAEPVQVVQETPIPSFRDVVMAKPDLTDELRWKILDLTVDHSFFCNLLRFILVATVFTSLLSIVVVYNDIRLTKK